MNGPRLERSSTVGVCCPRRALDERQVRGASAHRLFQPLFVFRLAPVNQHVEALASVEHDRAFREALTEHVVGNERADLEVLAIDIDDLTAVWIKQCGHDDAAERRRALRNYAYPSCAATRSWGPAAGPWRRITRNPDGGCVITVITAVITAL